MLREIRSAIICIFLFLLLFCSWIFIFEENQWMRSLGAYAFPSIGGMVSIVWLLLGYKSVSGPQRIFGLLLTIGMFFYSMSNFIWLMIQIAYGGAEYPLIVHLIWMLSYAIFLSALIYKFKVINKSVSNGTFIYNILIFMIASLSLSIHYLIQPILDYSSHSKMEFTLNLSYPVIDILILFTAINIYYLSRNTSENRFLFVVSAGFFIQIIADTNYAYLLLAGKYHPGSLTDLLWTLSILIIGLSSFYVQNEKEELDWKPIQTLKSDDGFLLNLSVVFLTILVIQSNHWQWNVLVIGLTLIITLIIVRQVFIMKRNRELLNELVYHAYFDQLTGLNNRACFQSELKQMMEKAKKDNSKLAILLLDLDRFKNINDTLGHEIGDYLLKACSVRLQNTIGQLDRIYRVGGDEFVIILPNATEEYCKSIAENILQKFTEPLFVKEYEILITPSLGISIYPDNGDNSELILKNADTSMYLAKSKGRNSFEFYSSELNDAISRKIKIENELRKAIISNQFALYYQPKVDLKSRKIVGMEALLRWQHPELGFVSPVEFIPIAEETGQIVSIGEWVLKTACKQTKDWQYAGLTELCVSVNVSVQQFKHSDFIKTVKKTLQEVNLDAKYLELEITESIIQNLKDSTRILSELKLIGVKTSIDDFGTGYSSLYVLKKLPIDTIKIDKSFIDNVSNKMDHSIVKTIIELGLNLNLEVVLEGIEYEEQVTDLAINYDGILGQGYLFGRPVPAEEFNDLFNK